MLGNVARGASRQRRAGHGSLTTVGVRDAAIDGNRHLARRRDREQVGARELQRQGIGARRVLQEELAGVAVPCGGVDDRLAVGRETSGMNGAAAERDLLEGRGRRADQATSDQDSGAKDRRDRRRHEGRAQEASRSDSSFGLAGRGLAGDRDLRQVVPDAAKVVREVARGGEAVLGVFGETALDGPAERSRGAGGELRDRLGVFADDRSERLRRRRPLEGSLSCRHLVEDRAERELVGAEVEGLAARLLGRHVADGAENGARPRFLDCRGALAASLRLVSQQLGQAEVEDLDVAVPGHHHVLGLQVAVDDAGRVGLAEAVGNLKRDIEQAPGRQRSFVQELPQRLALDELHRDVDRGVRCADVVDRDDVRVVQGRCRARLLLEAFAPIVVRGDGR